jgi:uncharacterized membrane protein YedE/YeeE
MSSPAAAGALPGAIPAGKERRKMIDWGSFTPATAVAGGILIGSAAAMLVLLNGRIAGISGIVGGLMRPAPGEVSWRAAFLVGMVSSSFAYSAFSSMPSITIEAGYPELIVAGLLVGFGTRYGGGCTSGHGVCGLARFSKRSLFATLTFMAAGFLTVFIARHVVGV